MRKLLAIGGEPGTGKSALVARLIHKYGLNQVAKYGTCYMHVGEGLPGLYVLGRYDDPAHAFPGTDRLSMAVITDALQFIGSKRSGVVVFEGDRLFNSKFIDGAQVDERLVLLLHTTPSVLKARREARAEKGNNQTATFLKGRATKYRNLMRERDDLYTVRHDSDTDLYRTLDRCIDFIGITPGGQNG